jgi:hypothetical protein
MARVNIRSVRLGWAFCDSDTPNRDMCKQLTDILQLECEFRFNFMGGADNPLVSFTEITCRANSPAQSDIPGQGKYF